MIEIIKTLLSAYGQLVPDPEPMCCHGFGVVICDICAVTGDYPFVSRGVVNMNLCRAYID